MKLHTVAVAPCGNLTIDIEMQVMTNSKQVKKGARLVVAGAKKAEQKKRTIDWRDDQKSKAARKDKPETKRAAKSGHGSAGSTVL